MSAVRKVQVIVRREDDDRVLLLRRPPDRGRHWQTVTGKAKKGERWRRAARRELAEETGIATPLDLSKLGLCFEFETRNGAAHEEVFVATVPRSAAVELSDEHDGYRWCRPEVAAKLVARESIREAIRRYIDWLEDLFGWDD
jgi:8-oxo-dGTP pyrophosphatase MutT (NUDIX family)